MQKKATSNQTELSKLRDENRFLRDKLFSAEHSLAKHDNEYQDKTDELDKMICLKDAKIKELWGRWNNPHHTY
jgi:hypothetical protein